MSKAHSVWFFVSVTRFILILNETFVLHDDKKYIELTVKFVKRCVIEERSVAYHVRRIAVRQDGMRRRPHQRDRVVICAQESLNTGRVTRC